MTDVTEMHEPPTVSLRIASTVSQSEEDMRRYAEAGRDLAESHNSDAYSQKLGYKSAPVGAAGLRESIHTIARAWGLPWIDHGGYQIRWRQPLFDGEITELRFSPLRTEGDTFISDFEIVNPAGVACIVGRASLPASPPQPPLLEDFPLTATPAVLPRTSEHDALVGRALASEEFSHGDLVERIRAGRFEVLASDGVNTPGRPLPAWMILPAYEALQDVDPTIAHADVALPWWFGHGQTGLDFTDTKFTMQTHQEMQCYTTVPADAELQVRSRVIEAFERKGSKYLKTEHLLVTSDGTPVMSKTWTFMTEFGRVAATS